jgi:AcrR family transcriptional regulator
MCPAGPPKAKKPSSERTGPRGLGATDPKIDRSRRQEIVDIAAAIFATKGYAATTIQDIGEGSGILKGSLYYYIDSKRDLLFAVIAEVHERMLDNLQQAQADQGETLTRIRAFVGRNILLALTELDKAAVFHHDFRHLSEEQRTSLIKERDRYERFFRELLREGQRAGVIDAGLDVVIASEAILTMSNSVYQWYHPEGRLSSEETVKVLTDLVVDGIARRK